MKTGKFTPYTEEYNSDFTEAIFYRTDDEKIYLDAVGYMKQVCGSTPEKSIEDFEAKFSFQIDSLCEVSGITKEDLLVRDQESGNIMIEERAEYLYLGYLDPKFSAYMYARMRELFTIGFTVSDKVIISAARERLGIDI